MKPNSLKNISSIIGTSTESTKPVLGYAVDSRKIKLGDLFFALPGEKVDGHLFIESAAAAGASAAVVSKHYKGSSFGLTLMPVEDVLSALQELSKIILKQGNAAIVAVTGSLGKTTTKDFITSILKQKFKVSSSPGNSNSQIGLPLAILNHTHIDDEIIVLEMGMTHPGKISKLIEIAPPDISVITTVALVHAENFDTLEDIARAKAEIFTHPNTNLGIYHSDSDTQGILKKTGNCNKITFSTTDSHSDYSLKHFENRIEISEYNQSPINLPLLNIPGAHNRQNLLAALAVARYFGMNWGEIERAQKTLELPERRLQLIEKFGVVFINDAYNASEMSMKAALDALPQPKPGGKRIAFLGGIVELGKFSEGCHKAVGKYALDHVDTMLCFGVDCLPIFQEWKSAGRPVVWAKERSELISSLNKQMQPGDVVLLKGSRSKEVWKVLDELDPSVVS